MAEIGRARRINRVGVPRDERPDVVSAPLSIVASPFFFSAHSTRLVYSFQHGPPTYELGMCFSIVLSVEGVYNRQIVGYRSSMCKEIRRCGISQDKMEFSKQSDTDFTSLPQIRRIMENDGTWFYNVTDVIAALTDTVDPTDYWVKMKKRGTSEGFEATLKKIVQFPMKSRKDGKLRQTDCADRETLLRLAQSIPSA